MISASGCLISDFRNKVFNLALKNRKNYCLKVIENKSLHTIGRKYGVVVIASIKAGRPIDTAEQKHCAVFQSLTGSEILLSSYLGP